MRAGYGACVYPDGRLYEGFWDKGLRNHSGRVIFQNGDIYEGEIKNELANGNGKFISGKG